MVDRRCNRHALTAMVFGRHHDAFELLQHVQVRDEGGGRVTLLVTLRTTNAATDVIWQRFDLRDLGIDWRAQAGKNRLKVVGDCQASS
ncbi:hypothetical protein [Steroidobacter denitrificans]|uniref:hypothetical protein n=1 Tax=Steroidobacter denitrificans TaxID=465721 RepID=UPI001AEF825C|nr:hypothetical protein [Steroidobacter denitrificans]